MFVKIQIYTFAIYLSLRTYRLCRIFFIPGFTDLTVSVLQSESPISSARTLFVSHCCPLYHSSTSQAWCKVEHRYTDVVTSGLILRKICRERLATYQIIIGELFSWMTVGGWNRMQIEVIGEVETRGSTSSSLEIPLLIVIRVNAARKRVLSGASLYSVEVPFMTAATATRCYGNFLANCTS